MFFFTIRAANPSFRTVKSSLMMSLLVAHWAASAAPAAAEDSDAAVVELRETISKIVDVETTRSREAADWRARRESMNELLGLHRKEIALLDEELERAGRSAAGHDSRREELETEIAAFKEVRREVRAAVERLRPRALAIAARFPETLAEEVEGDLYRLEDWTPDDDPREAVRAILEVIGAAEQFNRRITRETEIRGGREVEVIYLGLARAYYADRSGHAGVGVPGGDGMVWTPRPEIAAEVVKALDQLDRKRPPELVAWPLKIDGKEAP
jgi:hypothetical protein